MLRSTRMPHSPVRMGSRITGPLPVPPSGGTGGILLRSIFLVLLLWYVPSTRLLSQVAGEGGSFTIVVPYLSPSSTQSAEKIRLYFTSHLGSNVTVRYGVGGGVLNFSIPAGGSREEALDTTDLMLPKGQGTYRRMLHVTADNPVTVTLFIDRGTASEGYTAIPDNLCGFEYVTISETSLIEGTFLTVAAIEDDTRVRITPTTGTLGGDPPDVPIDVTLDRGEVYQLISTPRIDVLQDDDLSGSRVVADRPVAVHSGTTCLQLPIGSNRSCAPLIEQLPHVDALGRKYVLPLFPGEERTLMRAVPVCASVGLSADDFVDPVNIVVDGDSGTNVETYAPGIVFATQPVLLAHLGTNVSRRPPAGLDGPVGDPTMSILVPEEQMDTLFRFVVPTLPGRVDGNVGFPWVHFVTVTRPNLTTGATLNGSPLTFNGYVADTMINSGTHVVQSDGPVSVTPNGRSVSDAYAWVPGIVTRPFELVADTVTGVACFIGFDTVITVRNIGRGSVRIDRMEFLNDIVGTPTTELPVTIPRNDSLLIGVKFEGSRDSLRGQIVLYSGTGDCARRVGTIPVRMRGMPLQLDPPENSMIRFPELRPPNRIADTTITVRNIGRDTVDVTDIVVTPDRFILLDPIGPIRLLPGESREVTIRFQPEPGDDLVDGSVRFLTEPCPEDTIWTVRLQGKVRYVDVFHAAAHIDTTYCGVIEPDTLRIQVANYESVPLGIDSLRLSGGDPGEFTMPDPPARPIVIGPGDTLTLEIVYTPGSTGLRQGAVEIFAGLVDFRPYTVPIEVQAERYDFEFLPVSLDFGPLDCADRPERRIQLRNRGTVRLREFDVWFHRRVGFEHERTGSDPPGPGETLEIVVRSTGPPGEYRDTLHFVDRLCGTDILIPAHVLCTDSGAIRIVIPEVSGEIGERVEIPIGIEREGPAYGLGIPFELELTLRFQGEIFFPSDQLVGLPNGVSGEIVGTVTDNDDRLVELRFLGQMDAFGELGRLPGTILLGPSASTPIEVDTSAFRFDVSSDHFRTDLGTRDGSLEVSGFCEIGGTRFVRSSGEFGMRVAPNVTGSDVEILVDLVEDGRVTVELYDPGGRLVRTIYTGIPGSGRWSIPADLSELPVGLYTLRLRTATQRAEQRVLVGR